MAKVTSKPLLVEYILRQLGAPLVAVEATEDQIHDIIDSTIQLYSTIALEGELVKYVKMSVSAPCEITLDPAVQSIQKVSKGGGLAFPGLGGAGFVLDYNSLVSGGIDLKDAMGSVVNLSATRSLLDKYFGSDVNFTFNAHKKKMTITEPYGGNIMIEMAVEYIPDAVDYIYDHEWIKKMCVAKTKLLQSDTVGKYDQNLVGGARVNHDKMQARAEQDIQVYLEELKLNYQGPAPIGIG